MNLLERCVLRSAATYCVCRQCRSRRSVPGLLFSSGGLNPLAGLKSFPLDTIHSRRTDVLRLQLGSAADKNSSWCRRINSSRAFCTIADGSRGRTTVRFRQIHSSKASETSCCLVMPRYLHCLVNHSNCSELTTMRSSPPDRSGSSGDDGCHSSFRTYQIAAER